MLRQSPAMLLLVGIVLTRWTATAAAPGDAPPLPMSGTRVVRVATESQLQAAMNDLRHGDTVLLADGSYALTRSLYINGRNDVTVRGAAGSTNVVLRGQGMDNANHGGVPFGVWSNGTNTTVAHLTIRDTYDNPVIFNPGAQSPRVYCVRLLNAGSQFLKSNPTDVSAGLGVNDGRVEYCWFEYTGAPPADHGAGAGYFNGISAHAARDWIVRGNLFKNLHNPDSAAYLWNPAVLFWRNSRGTLTERNVFHNVDRAVAYGLDDSTPYTDHAGGVIRNNFVCLDPGFLSASRQAGSDGTLIAWNSPGTQIDHNTLLLNSNLAFAIEFRFRRTTNATARNNLADTPLHLRDKAAATLAGNTLGAAPSLFANPRAADLHLLPGATNVIDQAAPGVPVPDDFDGDTRPRGARPDSGADEFGLNAPPVITGFYLSGQQPVLAFTTFLGLSYDVQRAEEVHGSPASLVVTQISGTGGVVQAVDPEAATDHRRFYWVRLSP